MKKHLPLTLLLCLLLMAGCQTLEQDKYGELRMSQEAFTGTVHTLIELHKAGQIAPDEVVIVSQLIHTGEKYLVEWEAALKSGSDEAHLVAAFHTALDTLITYTE